MSSASMGCEEKEDGGTMGTANSSIEDCNDTVLNCTLTVRERILLDWLQLDSADKAEACQNLLVCYFPMLDPEYLRQQYLRNPDGFEVLVDELCLSDEHDHPTLEDYRMRKANHEQLAEQLATLSDEEMAQLWEDPVAHFEQDIDKTESDGDAELNYLLARYRTISRKILIQTLNSHGNRLVPTCNALDKLQSIAARRRENWECKGSANVHPVVLREIFFVENRELILSTKRRMLESVRQSLLNCPICCEDELSIETMAACEEGHLFCKTCIQKSAETLLGEGKFTFPCLDLVCTAEFSSSTLQDLLGAVALSQAEQRRAADEIRAANIVDLVSCPFCSFAAILDPAISVFSCQNVTCAKLSCRLCKKPDHLPLRCSEVEEPEEVRMRLQIEDKMTTALIRTCPKCNRQFIKDEGCNKMCCPCGTIMCYVCRAVVEGYSHFDDNYRACRDRRRKKKIPKCPLWSHNDDVNVRTVINVAKRAREELVLQNPGVTLKVDPTLNLPKTSHIG